MKNVRLVCIVVGVGLLLLIPLVAGFPWSRFDFILAGVLLLSTGLACEVALRVVKETWIKVAAVGAILFGLIMVWGALVRLG